MMDKLTTPILAFVIGFILMVLAWPHIARGHDIVQLDPSLHGWAARLKNLLGIVCCNGADGDKVEDWTPEGAGYRVKFKGEWLRADPSSIVKAANIAGFPIVWVFYENGAAKVRCFLPTPLY